MANEVKDFYDKYWQRFDVSRVRIWKCVKEFTSTLVKNSTVLDLFSGVGSFGIECLSNEAKYVTFVENYQGVLPILEQNLKNLKLEGRFEIINQNIFSDLSLKRNNYDIIFLDPPYKQGNIDKLIDEIFHKKLLKNKGLIILHRNKKSKENYSKYLKVLDEKNYGISKIMFGTLK